MTAIADRLSQSVESAINRASGGRPVPGNRVALLHDGPSAYDVMLDAIAGAERWIHFENYIIRSDSVGWMFAEQLADRARSGVHVRLLYDWIGSIATARRYWRYLRDAGVEVRRFNGPKLLDIFANFARNHRKLVVADGQRAVLGGLCIGREWTGDGAPGCQPWRDTAVEIEGPAAAMLDQSFARTWGLAGGAIPAGQTIGRARQRGSAAVRVIAGEPGRERAYRVVELLAAGAISRLWITDAYFVAPPRLIQALLDAAQDGVDVRLLVPGSSDLPFIRNLTRIGYRNLLRAGVRIYEWDGPMLHAKTIVADGRWTRIGSSNLNASSLFGNYELDVLIEDATLADMMEAQFRRDIARSREVASRRLRGPERISQVLPTTLEWQVPEAAEEAYRPPLRETRQRAALALRTVARNARRSVYGPMMVLLILLGVLFFLLPRASAYVFGVLCVWFAAAAGREAFRRRADR